MRTQALRVTVGAYENGSWHITLIEDSYLRGVLVNSDLLVGPIYCAEHQVKQVAMRELDRLIAMERHRLELLAAG